MEQFLAVETLVIGLLLIVSIVAIVVRGLRVPYTVALVIVGLLMTFQQTIRVELTPQLILTLFVPPLLFEAALHSRVRPAAQEPCSDPHFGDPRSVVDDRYRGLCLFL